MFVLTPKPATTRVQLILHVITNGLRSERVYLHERELSKAA
jgi:hypothetical protein